jgi:perosamine synthetase
MAEKKQSDFRYNTGAAKVPWAAVGENYNADDLIALVRFLAQKNDDGWDPLARKVEDDIRELVRHSRAPGKLSLGDHVAALEGRIARFLQVPDCAFVTNATAGFEIAYRYANLKAGDEVICPAITFIATIAYPLSVGAKIVFADVDERTINLDPRDVERKITPRTKMIVPVHIGGWPVDMDPIMEIARTRDILVLEDAAHAFGAKYKGRMAGAIGHFGAFSFHEVKNVTSFGEGGVLATTLPFVDELKKARFLGLDLSKKIPNWLYDVVALPGKYGPFVAQNSSSTEVQAIGLMRQMDRIGAIIEQRRKNAEFLNERFASCDAIVPQRLDTPDIQASYHLYLLQIDPQKARGDIQALKGKLSERGITNIPHFAPLYKFDVVKQMGYDVAAAARGCPVAEEVFNRRFTHLPLYGLDREQLGYLAESVPAAVREMQAGK